MSLFQMSVAGGVLILFIVVIRALAIHRLPKTTFLALWMIAALRLLLPFSIPLTFNIHIGLDVFSDVVQELPSGNIASTLPGDSPPSYDIGTAVPSPATEQKLTRIYDYGYTYDKRGNLVKEEEICSPTTTGPRNITMDLKKLQTTTLR